MAAVTPQDLLGSNYAYDASSDELTIASADLLPVGELVDAEAHATTGNGVKVSWAVINTICENYTNLATADKPERMEAYQGSYRTNADGTVSQTFTITFDFTVGDIADEPSS